MYGQVLLKKNQVFLWIQWNLAEKGIYTLDPLKKRIENISQKYQLDRNHINCITGNDQYIYIGTTDGLYKYEIEKKSFKLLERVDLPAWRGPDKSTVFLAKAHCSFSFKYRSYFKFFSTMDHFRTLLRKVQDFFVKHSEFFHFNK